MKSFLIGLLNILLGLIAWIMIGCMVGLGWKWSEKIASNLSAGSNKLRKKLDEKRAKRDAEVETAAAKKAAETGKPGALAAQAPAPSNALLNKLEQVKKETVEKAAEDKKSA